MSVDNTRLRSLHELYGEKDLPWSEKTEPIIRFWESESGECWGLPFFSLSAARFVPHSPMYRTLASPSVGLFLTSTKNTPGRYAMEAIARDFDAIKNQIGGTVILDKGLWIGDSVHVGSLDQPAVRQRAFSWLAERINTFVRVLRPRIRSAAADYQSRGE